MNRLVLASIAAAWGGLCAAAQVATIRDFYGTWRLDKLVGSAAVSEDPATGQRDVGRMFVISAGKVVSTSDGACDAYPPRYVRKKLRAVLEDWQVSENDLALGSYRLPATASLVDTPCPQGIVLKPDELLVSQGDGFIYLASRVK